MFRKFLDEKLFYNCKWSIIGLPSAPYWDTFSTQRFCFLDKSLKMWGVFVHFLLECKISAHIVLKLN